MDVATFGLSGLMSRVRVFGMNDEIHILIGYRAQQDLIAITKGPEKATRFLEMASMCGAQRIEPVFFEPSADDFFAINSHPSWSCQDPSEPLPHRNPIKDAAAPRNLCRQPYNPSLSDSRQDERTLYYQRDQ